MPLSRELLEQKVALFAEAEQVANMGWWSWEASTDEVFFSDNACRLHGLIPGVVAPDLAYLFERVHPDDRDRVMEVMAQGCLLYTSDAADE